MHKYEKEKRKFYECNECHLKYKEKGLAKRCQKWCEEHKSCNLEITRHAVKKT